MEQPSQLAADTYLSLNALLMSLKEIWQVVKSDIEHCSGYVTWKLFLCRKAPGNGMDLPYPDSEPPATV